MCQTFVVRPTPAIEDAPPIPGESSPIFERAAEQFAVFEGRLRAGGLAPFELPSVPEPLGPSVADLAVLLPQGAFLMRPSDLGLRGAVDGVEAALGRAGVPLLGRIEPPGLLDGGDVLIAGDTAYLAVPEQRRAIVGIPARRHGNEHGRRQFAALAQRAGLKTVEVLLSAAVERLRSVAAYLGDNTFVASAELLDCSVFAGAGVLRVESGDDYGAGLLWLGGRRVVSNVRFRTIVPQLRAAGFTVDAIDLWEFGKAGLTPSLLALPLPRA